MYLLSLLLLRIWICDQYFAEKILFLIYILNSIVRFDTAIIGRRYKGIWANKEFVHYSK